MSQEIVYTSAPEGLKPGSKGFCTVESTSGMAKNLAQRLEALSGYRHEFSDQSAGLQNPVNYSHLKINVAGQQYHVLSRICDYGIDYSRRTNKLAHHVALRRAEVVKAFAGPAAALVTPGFCKTKWDGKPKLLGAGTDLTRVDQSVSPEAVVCKHWQRLTGDAGWGGVLAESAISRGAQPAFVIFPPPAPNDNQDQLLHLVAESLKLVPPNKRWDVTFSTYYTELLVSETCQWRFVMEGTKEAQALRSNPHARYIDLCSRGPAPESDLAVAARGLLPPPWTAAPQSPAPASKPARGPRPAAAAQDPLDTLLPVESAAAEPILQPAAAATLPPQHGAPPNPFARPKKRVNYWLFVAIALMFMMPVMFIGGYFAAGGFNPKLPAQTAANDSPSELVQGNLGAAPAPDATDDEALVDEHNSTATEDPPTANGNIADGSTELPDTAEPESAPTGEPTEDAVAVANSTIETVEAPAEEKQDPFEELDKRTVDANKLVVLELPSAPGRRNKIPDAAEIARLFIDDPDQCELELIGADVVFDEGQNIRIVHPEHEIWEVVAEETRNKTTLGTFSWDGGALSFQWQRTPDRLSADRLRWCLLEIRVGEQFKRCRLRPSLEPIAASFVPVEAETGIELVDDDEVLPPAENLRFELKPQGLPPHDARNPKSALPALHFMASVKPRRAAHFALQWEFVPKEPPAKLVITSVVAYHPLIENSPDNTRQPLVNRSKNPKRVTLWSRTKHDAWVERLKTLQDKYETWRTDVPYPDLQDAIDWIGNLTEQRARHPDTPKYQQRVDKWNKRLTAALAEIKANMDQLTTLDPIVAEIGENGQWHYRIYITIGGQQVDVVRTHGFPES